MKEQPILFSGPMVRAILEGRKTQTRRVIKCPAWTGCDNWADAELEFDSRNKPVTVCDATGCLADILCPYGELGSYVWVREPWASDPCYDHLPPREIPQAAGRYYMGNGFVENWHKYRHARFMPRWASRITMGITDIRVERVQSISEEDAQAEGIYSIHQKSVGPIPPGNAYYYGQQNGGFDTAVQCFEFLWDSINGNRPGHSWSDNPWCWCLSFRRIKPASSPLLGDQESLDAKELTA